MKEVNCVVTGLGCICSAGDSLCKVMESIYSGIRNPGAPKRIQVDLNREYPAFEVASDLDNHEEIKETGAARTTKLALLATCEALKQSKIGREELLRFSVGVCIGSTVGCTLNNEPFYRDYRKNKKPGMDAITRYLNNNTARYLADELDLNGPVATVANACSSGTDAIGLGKLWLENDLCDIVIAGGADELSRIVYLGFISLLITSTEPCRPFDRNRNGLNLGEGAGIVILEKSKTARRRGAPALAGAIGYGCSADAYHPTAPHPEGKGLARAINQALHQADISVDEIGFVNAHGTSTLDNDRVEGRTIASLISEDVPVVSTKGYTGHTLGASGGIEAVLTVQGLCDQRLPQTLGFQEGDPDCIICPTTENIDIRAETALSNSLAFGGNNSSLLFCRI